MYLNICVSFKKRKGCRGCIAQESANMLLFFQISPNMLLCYVMLLKYLLLNAHVLKSVGFCYHYTSGFVVPAYSANCAHSTRFLNFVVCYL